MALPTMQWKYVGLQAFGSNTVASVLDAIYTLGTKTAYANGDSRSPGSASAGTYSRFQASGVTEAVYAVPPTTTSLAQKWIWAGSASSKSPPMASPDTWTTGDLLVSVNKNSGAFNAWDNAAPFTSGEFFGYWKAWTPASAASVYMWECQEAVMVGIRRTNGNMLIHCLGAFLNPGSTESTDAESDERVYGVMTTGTTVVSTMTGSTTTSTSFFGNGTSSGNCHTGIFTPGGSTLKSGQRNLQIATANVNIPQTTSGRYAFSTNCIPINLDSSPIGALLGVIRDTGFFGYAQTGQVVSNSGTDLGYIVGKSATGNNESIILLRNA